MRVFFLTIFFLLLSLPAQAASIFFKSTDNQLFPGHNLTLKLMIDSQGQVLNAFEGEVVFPDKALELLDVQDNNSLVNFWVEKPELMDPGKIKFSGITPGGFSGQAELFKIIFKAKSEAQAFVKIENSHIFLNDGQGTEALLSAENFYFEVSDEFDDPEVISVGIRDIVEPEIFQPYITKMPDIYGDKYVLIFYTQDKGSGIDHYEVREGYGVFKKAISPYVLKNQNLSSDIVIKAVDRSGNERRITIKAPQPGSYYENYQFFAIIIGLAILLIILRRVLWKKPKQKQKKL